MPEAARRRRMPASHISRARSRVKAVHDGSRQLPLHSERHIMGFVLGGLNRMSGPYFAVTSAPQSGQGSCVASPAEAVDSSGVFMVRGLPWLWR
ncbi:hypothetical protein D9M72_325820 [compost metagenome]